MFVYFPQLLLLLLKVETSGTSSSSETKLKVPCVWCISRLLPQTHPRLQRAPSHQIPQEAHAVDVASLPLCLFAPGGPCGPLHNRERDMRHSFLWLSGLPDAHEDRSPRFPLVVFGCRLRIKATIPLGCVPIATCVNTQFIIVCEPSCSTILTTWE